MKITSSLLGLSSLFLFSLVQAQGPVACPTATRTIQNRGCRNECPFTDCAFQTTIRNPCGCPASIPTATLIAPCEAPCPYQGCDIEFRTSALACPTTSSSTRRWPPWISTTSTSTSTTFRRTTSTTVRSTTRPTTTQTAVVTSVVTLPPPTRTTSTPCPTVTRITSPADCPPIRCPVPTCQVRTTLGIPCNCVPRTVLWVQGCATACPEGCLTRTETLSAANC
ncbi:hypothetical protein QBC44DRAFT_316902 [Cladorrhinum sp. PSN332]|nr:hypothetical protein QBC44DRAFT_316902 [Cladorrhinum sp. PSN332]